MKKHQYIIGIDPDVDKSGLAWLNTSTRQLEAVSLPFPELLDHLLHIKAAYRDNAIVVVEASWLISHNWHTRSGDNRRVSAAKGNNVGRNHEVGRKIVEMCKHYGLEVVEQSPLKKCWQGKDGKITHEELNYFTGITGRTNSEMRDACLLAWNYAGLPIRVKPITIKKKTTV